MTSSSGYSCTGDDALIDQLAAFAWNGPKLFLSAAVGLYAKRLFVFVARGTAFPAETLAEMLNPWLQTERAEFSGQELPWEGTGCWHPVFPARAGDFALFAAAVLRRLEAAVRMGQTDPDLLVLEQHIDADGVLTVRCASLLLDDRDA